MGAVQKLLISIGFGVMVGFLILFGVIESANSAEKTIHLPKGGSVWTVCEDGIENVAVCRDRNFGLLKIDEMGATKLPVGTPIVIKVETIPEQQPQGIKLHGPTDIPVTQASIAPTNKKSADVAAIEKATVLTAKVEHGTSEQTADRRHGQPESIWTTLKNFNEQYWSSVTIALILTLIIMAAGLAIAWKFTGSRREHLSRKKDHQDDARRAIERAEFEKFRIISTAQEEGIIVSIDRFNDLQNRITELQAELEEARSQRDSFRKTLTKTNTENFTLKEKLVKYEPNSSAAAAG